MVDAYSYHGVAKTPRIDTLEFLYLIIYEQAGVILQVVSFDLMLLNVVINDYRRWEMNFNMSQRVRYLKRVSI